VTAGRRVLMVEDDHTMADMYRLGLESRGFDVTVLRDAMVLNETVGHMRPDVLILDWELPIIRGDEALERLRRVEHGRLLPVLILSNFPGTEHGAIDRVFRAGALAWLEKVNTTPALLARRLNELVGPAPPN